MLEKSMMSFLMPFMRVSALLPAVVVPLAVAGSVPEVRDVSACLVSLGTPGCLRSVQPVISGQRVVGINRDEALRAIPYSGWCPSVLADHREGIERTAALIPFTVSPAGEDHHKGIELTCGLNVAAPAYVISVDVMKSQLTLFDSEGTKAANPVLSLWSHSRLQEPEEFGVHVVSKTWTPSPGSRWVGVKGTVAVVVAQESFSSTGAVLATAHGSIAPVVLNVKGRRGDRLVKAQLSVQKEYGRRKDEPGSMVLRLVAPESLDIKRLALFTSDDGFKSRKAVQEKWVVTREEKAESGRYVWSLECMFFSDFLPGESIGVDITGSAALRHVEVPVDVKAGLCGELGPDGKDLVPPEKMSYGESPPAWLKEITEEVAWPVTVACDGWAVDDGGQLMADIRVNIKPPLMFWDKADVRQQLDVTDSTGKKLFPALAVIEGAEHKEMQSVRTGVIFGRELVTAGASWGRIHGVLQMPVVMMQESAVYEMGLIPGGNQLVELAVQQPVHQGEGPNGDTVAVAEAIPTGVMTLKSWEKIREKGKDRIRLNLALTVDGTDCVFDLAEFVFLDGNDRPIKVDRAGVVGGRDGRVGGWSEQVVFDDPGGMDRLRVRLKYRAGKKLVPVPVDINIGLGGVIKPARS